MNHLNKLDCVAVLSSIKNNKTTINSITLPNEQGIYGIFLKAGSIIDELNINTDLIYIGKAEKSLNSRDYKTHFSNGKSGSSTVRRSLGALLKKELNLTAIPRSQKRTKQDMYNFKFKDDDEIKLTNWMNENLLIGYFIYYPHINNGQTLRDFEEELLSIATVPLDLDPRTRNKNRFANVLMRLRKICKEEAESCTYIK